MQKSVGVTWGLSWTDLRASILALAFVSVLMIGPPPFLIFIYLVKLCAHLHRVFINVYCERRAGKYHKSYIHDTGGSNPINKAVYSSIHHNKSGTSRRLTKDPTGRTPPVVSLSITRRYLQARIMEPLLSCSVSLGA